MTDWETFNACGCQRVHSALIIKFNINLFVTMQHGIVFKKKDTDYLIKNNQVTEMDYSWWSVEDEIRSLTV